MEALLDGAFHARGRDAMLLVVRDLPGAAVFRHINEGLHAAGDLIREKDDLAIDVTRGAACRLDEAGLAAQVAFLVGVEDADEAHLGKVEAFAEEVDADEDVALPRAKTSQDFYALDGIDVAVQIADFQADIAQIVRKILSRALGQRGDEDALADVDALAAKLDGSVDLAFQRLDRDLRIDEASGADDLLDNERRSRRDRIECLLPGLARAGFFPTQTGGGFLLLEPLGIGQVACVADDAVADFKLPGVALT